MCVCVCLLYICVGIDLAGLTCKKAVHVCVCVCLLHICVGIDLDGLTCKRVYMREEF